MWYSVINYTQPKWIRSFPTHSMVERCWHLSFTADGPTWQEKNIRHLSVCFRSYVFTDNSNTLTSIWFAFLIVYPRVVKVWLAQQFPSEEIFEVLLCVFTPEQCRAFQIDQTWGWPHHCCHSRTMECGNRQPLSHRIHCRPVLNATIRSIAYNLQNVQTLRCCTVAKIIITYSTMPWFP